MIKPFHENKTALSIDDSKIQSIDLLPAILQMVCGDNADYKDFEGYAPSDIPKNRVRKVHRFVHVDGLPEPEEKCYGGNCIEEYNFVDLDSFELGAKSKSFVRRIPLVTSQNDK